MLISFGQKMLSCADLDRLRLFVFYFVFFVFIFFTRQFNGCRALLWCIDCIILTPACIITTLRPSFTTKSNPFSGALRTKKTKCTVAGANPGSLQMQDSKRATVTVRLRCLFFFSIRPIWSIRVCIVQFRCI